MDGDIHNRRQWQHNMLLSISIIIAIFLFLAVSYNNDIAIKTHQQNHYDNVSSLSSSIDREKEIMQLNPKLPIYIQNIILDSRLLYNDTSSSMLHNDSGGIPASIRKRRRELTTINCIESYHVSIVPEEVNTCTNSNYYPVEWTSTPLQKYMFHTTSTECCAEMLALYNTFGNNAVVEFDAPTYCNVIDVCADHEDNERSGVESGGEEGTSGEGNGPNVHSIPPTLPTEPITTTIASSTTSISTSTLTTTTTSTTTTSSTTTQNPCQSTKKYHPTSIQLKTCTNNNNYPKLWTASSELVAEYFFDSFEECCAAFYSPPLGAGTISDGVGGEGKECIVEDVCLDTPTGYPLYYLDLDFGICIQQSDSGDNGEGMINLFNTLEECCNFDWIEDTTKCLSDSPLSSSSLTFHHDFTPSPTSPEPTSSPPTFHPSKVSEISTTSCTNKWHVSIDINKPNTCTNDDQILQSWKDPNKRHHFLFSSAEECCDVNFGTNSKESGECNLINICPSLEHGDLQHDNGEEVTPWPTIAQTNRPSTLRPTPKRTSHPTTNDKWYINRSSGKCVQDCEGESPCGGLVSQWETSYATAEACCQSQPWVVDCIATPSPTDEPTTSSPSVRPTRRPTNVPTTSYPTKPITQPPTLDCSSYKWHMSTLDDDASNTCTNDLEYPDEWIDSDYFLHDTIEGCCAMFGGDCVTRDWCTEQNQDKINGAKLQNEGTFQKYDGIIIWNFGSPPEWEVDSETSWMINIPSSETSVIRSLITEVNLPNRGSIVCNIKVDISMPFDRFSILVNGQQVHQYYQRVEEWTSISSDLVAGDNMIEFRVTNGDMFPGFDRLQMSHYGTGYVSIDECEIVIN